MPRPTQQAVAVPARDDRDSAAKRGYGRRWQRLAAMVLARQPLCACGQAATEVHHIKPKRDGGGETLENLVGMCKACHSRETTTARKRAQTP